MVTSQILMPAAKADPRIVSVMEDHVPCECMLCDDPEGHSEMAVEWRLIWHFNRPPAAEFGEGIMLLCEHCLRDWLENPDDFGGDPVSYHAV